MGRKAKSVGGEIQWRWADPQGQQRLVRLEELRAALAGGVVAPNTLVWRSGWARWRPAYEVDELSANGPANGATPNIPPPPLFIVAVQHEYEDTGGSREDAAEFHAEPPPPPRYMPGPAPGPPPGPPPARGVALFPVIPLLTSVPTPAPKVDGATTVPGKAANSSGRMKAAVPQPPTLAGLGSADTSPSSEPAHSATLKTAPLATVPAARPSSFPPDEAGWDLDPKPAKNVPPPAPSETLAGGRAPSPASGSDANTAVDITRLSVADAERILSGGPSHPTVLGVPAIPHPVLPPPPPLRSPSAPLTAPPPVASRIETPAFGAGQMPTASSPPRGKSTSPPPLRKRGHTLLLYGGAPKDDPAEEPKAREAAPINVPAPGVQAPKAVTQAPPWTGESKLDTTIPPLPPASLPPIRPMMDSIEEISGSVLLAEDSAADVTARRQKIEDLSSSHVLPDASGPAPALGDAGAAEHAFPVTTTLRGEPAPPAPAEAAGAPVLALSAAAPPATSGERAAPPDVSEPLPLLAARVVPPSPSRRVVHDLNEVWKPTPGRWMTGAWIGGGAFVLLGSIALLWHALRGASAAESPGLPAEPVISAVASTSLTVGADPVKAAAARAKSGVDIASVPSNAPCVLVGTAHVIAPKAMVRAGIETTASQSRVALGFATTEKDGLAVALDPSSLSATTAHQHSHEAIKRLVPQLGAGRSVSAVADVDRKGERISGARTIVEGSLVLGAAEGKLVWAPRVNDAPHPLWSLESDAPVEALRAAALEDGGFVVAFRQGGAIFVGALGPDRSARGGLSRIAGLGPQVGSPAVAASGETALVAWADRPATSDAWMLRIVHWHAGRLTGDPQPYPIPPGGLGQEAMSPGVTGVAGGRFLLSWTEGPVASHQVRAQTLSTTGESLGPPLTISGDGVNAGQGQPVILPDGRGLVAYLAAPTGATAQVVATPFACPLIQP